MASPNVPVTTKGWRARIVPGFEPTEDKTRVLQGDREMFFRTTDALRIVILVVGFFARLAGCVSKSLARLIRSTGLTWRTETVINFGEEVVGFPGYRFIEDNGTKTEWRFRVWSGPLKVSRLRAGNSRQSMEFAFMGLDGVAIPFNVERTVVIDLPADDVLVADVPSV